MSFMRTAPSSSGSRRMLMLSPSEVLKASATCTAMARGVSGRSIAGIGEWAEGLAGASTSANSKACALILTSGRSEGAAAGPSAIGALTEGLGVAGGIASGWIRLRGTRPRAGNGGSGAAAALIGLPASIRVGCSCGAGGAALCDGIWGAVCKSGALCGFGSAATRIAVSRGASSAPAGLAGALPGTSVGASGNLTCASPKGRGNARGGGAARTCSGICGRAATWSRAICSSNSGAVFAVSGTGAPGAVGALLVVGSGMFCSGSARARPAFGASQAAGSTGTGL